VLCRLLLYGRDHELRIEKRRPELPIKDNGIDMGADPEQQETPTRDPVAVLEDLFVRARDRDEFEYASALLRIRGMQDAGWDPLEESGALVSDLLSLLDAPLEGYTKIRLGLLLYSHITEVDAIYVMVVNLIEITAGERYSFDPFQDLYGARNRPRYEHVPPSAKRVVDRVRERAIERDLPAVADLVDWYFNNAVRNAFFHSDYILYQDEFRSGEGTFIDDDGRLSPSLKLDKVLDLINRSVQFYGAFVSTYAKHRSSYTADKQIEGRLGADGGTIPITLLASPDRGGLYGFRG
jgi:hypothetical protein